MNIIPKGSRCGPLKSDVLVQQRWWDNPDLNDLMMFDVQLVKQGNVPELQMNVSVSSAYFEPFSLTLQYHEFVREQDVMVVHRFGTFDKFRIATLFKKVVLEDQPVWLFDPLFKYRYLVAVDAYQCVNSVHTALPVVLIRAIIDRLASLDMRHINMMVTSPSNQGQSRWMVGYRQAVGIGPDGLELEEVDGKIVIGNAYICDNTMKVLRRVRPTVYDKYGCWISHEYEYLIREWTMNTPERIDLISDILVPLKNESR